MSIFPHSISIPCQLSLSLALTKMGYPTLHTYQLVADEFDILEMWTEKVFRPAIETQELSMGEPDFDVITAHGYTATADLPTSLYYKEIQEKYPNCKFILTTRDNPEVWFRSWNVLITSVSRTTAHVFQHMFYHVRKVAMYFRWVFTIFLVYLTARSELSILSHIISLYDINHL